MRITTLIAVAAALQLGVAAAAAQEPQPPRPPPATVPSSESDRPSRPDADSSWGLHVSIANVLSNNIHFDREDIQSYGLVLGAAVNYTVWDDVVIGYEVANHRYQNTSRWDRVSHLFYGEAEYDLARWITAGLEGLVAFKGSSEDRDLVDRDFDLEPRLDIDVAPGMRIRLHTRHRLKQYLDAPETDAVKHYAGAEFRRTTPGGGLWEIGTRFETNREELERGTFTRWTHAIEYAIPLTARARLAVGVRYQLKRYPERFVTVDDEDVPRLDHRWLPTVTWSRPVGNRTEFRVQYAYESQFSLDPGRVYDAHVFQVGLGHRWQ